MPFLINPKNSQFEVVDPAGRIYGTHPTRAQALAQQRALYANEAETDKASADYPWDKCMSDQLEEYGDEETARKVCGSIRAKYGEYRALSEKERGDLEAELNISHKEAGRPSLIDRIVNALKEGRRNSTTDAERLQQIHDLAVENGASCPLVFKQANGRYRWILLSTNSYQDRDGEIVSQAALEADTARMKASNQYGPLRLWHIGDPDPVAHTPGVGVDIGDGDYAEMFGRVRVESGTFRDERVAAAIKERSDRWAGSVGFFHPLTEPDLEGVYHSIETFERSLLPRGRESNPLTSLIGIIKENDMTTIKEKADQLAALLGDEALAETVMQQAAAAEKAAQERGLKYKAAETVEAAGVTTKAPKKAKKAKKAAVKKGGKKAGGGRGSSGGGGRGGYSSDEQRAAMFARLEEDGERTSEKAFGEDDAAEADDEIEVDAEDIFDALHDDLITLVDDRIKSALAGLTGKEAGLESQMKEITAVLKQLTGELPRGVKDAYRATRDSGTLATDEQLIAASKAAAGQVADPLADFFAWMTNSIKHQPPQA